nr:ThuA domain-containing protein [Candidatus Sigynarchaeota archaeon]
MTDKIRVICWNEFRHEKKPGIIQTIYPNGIHEAIADALRKEPDMDVKTAWLDQKEHGLTEKVLDNTDVLIWWGHGAHDEVKDEIVDRIQDHVLNGMGFIALHSSHFSKPFKRLMGTSGSLQWRERAEKCHVWCVNPYHPIAKGLDDVIEIAHEEMYGEFFDIPEPDSLVFISWFEGGEVFRSGCTWHRGKGKIFYFQPGHESFPNYYQPEIQKVIVNAVRWCKFDGSTQTRHIGVCPNAKFTLNILSNPSEREEDFM